MHWTSHHTEHIEWVQFLQRFQRFGLPTPPILLLRPRLLQGWCHILSDRTKDFLLAAATDLEESLFYLTYIHFCLSEEMLYSNWHYSCRNDKQWLPVYFQTSCVPIHHINTSYDTFCAIASKDDVTSTSKQVKRRGLPISLCQTWEFGGQSHQIPCLCKCKHWEQTQKEPRRPRKFHTTFCRLGCFTPWPRWRC